MEEPAAEADKGISQPEPEPEQISENHHPQASVTQNQDSASLLSTPEPLSDYAAELKDDPNILDLQDNVPDRQDIITSRFFKKGCSLHLTCHLFFTNFKSCFDDFFDVCQIFLCALRKCPNHTCIKAYMNTVMCI